MMMLRFQPQAKVILKSTVSSMVHWVNTNSTDFRNFVCGEESTAQKQVDRLHVSTVFEVGDAARNIFKWLNWFGISRCWTLNSFGCNFNLYNQSQIALRSKSKLKQHEGRSLSLTPQFRYLYLYLTGDIFLKDISYENTIIRKYAKRHAGRKNCPHGPHAPESRVFRQLF